MGKSRFLIDQIEFFIRVFSYAPENVFFGEKSADAPLASTLQIGRTKNCGIQHNGDLLSYTGSDSIGTISDKRLKENIEDFSYSLDTFKQLETKIFEWKNPDAHASSGSEIGFLAQDVELIDSRWVSDFFIDQNHPDYDLLQDTHITDVDENENETLLGKTTSTILGRKDVMYISVIQQLLGKVETLETKVTALENA